MKGFTQFLFWGAVLLGGLMVAALTMVSGGPVK